MAVVAEMIESQKISQRMEAASHKPVYILQQNCQKSEVAWYATLESGLELGADLVLIQEPPTFQGYSHRGYYLHSKRGGGRAMTAVRISANLQYEVREDLGDEADGDLVILDILLPERLRIVNIYNQKIFRDRKQINIRPAENAQWDNIIDNRCVIAGDFNAHSPRWGSEYSRDSRYWEDLMDNYNMDYVADGKPTRFNSIIDLVLATSSVICKAEIVDDERHATKIRTHNTPRVFSGSSISP